MTKPTAESVVELLIKQGIVLPEHKQDMISAVDREMRRATERKIREISDVVASTVVMQKSFTGSYLC